LFSLLGICYKNTNILKFYSPFFGYVIINLLLYP
jgi:hypothetical protein